MRLMKALAALAVTVLLASCGGGGCDAGSSPLTGAAACGGSTVVNPVATKLVLQLDRLSVNNSGGESVTATATATTTGGQTVKGVPVSFAVDANALYTPAATATDDNGVVAATVAIGSDRSNRIVTVTATSGSLTTTASFAVTGAALAGTPVPAVVLPSSTGNKINFVLKDANAAVMPNQSISVTAASLGTTSGTTDANGAYVYNYTAPATAGNLDITATAGGSTITTTVVVQATSGAIPAVTTAILSASVSANPSVVSTNSDGTNNQTQIRALFVGASNQPIKNVRVRFDLDGDANSIGGTFTTGANIVYSDANGVATTSYVPGSRSSPTDGLTIRACFDSVDFTTCDPTKATKTTITVISEPLAVSIGTNNVVDVQSLTYSRQFIIQVVDASGRAKANVDIVPSIDLPLYMKGQYGVSGGAWQLTTAPAVCLNEDLNRNGVLEIGEDLNKNVVLDPRKSDVAVTMVGSSKTDATGQAVLQITYPKNVATWEQVKILVAATGISGTEGRATWSEILPAPASDFTTTTASPPFQRSPYGVATTTVGSVTYADGSTATNVAPCSNPN